MNAIAYTDQVAAATAAIQKHLRQSIKIGIVLGTGLGSLAKEIHADVVLDYQDIPYFPLSTVESHHGKLILGHLEGVPVLALQGRFHLYEGYNAQEITLPIRVLAQLGIETLLISNAAGGMNPLFRRGDLMLITDHINLQGANPLVGANRSDWGPRFPDMSDPYTRSLRDLTEAVALEQGIKLHQGVYIAVAGPNLETRAEYRFLRQFGGDVVGMSTVPEVIVAAHMGLKVMAISVITDECFPDALAPVSIPEILAAAAEAEPKLAALMKGVSKRLNENS